MNSKLARIVKTFTFRLALVYVGLFSLSVIVLFAFIYTFAMRYLEAKINDSIKMQYSYLVDEYRQEGSAGVEARIRKMIADDDEGNEIYLLVNQKYDKLVGNLNEWPTGAAKETPFEKEGYWARFRIEGASAASANGIPVRAIMVPLSKYRLLLVGQTLSATQRIEQTILQTFWASLLLTLLMAFIGAIVMTRSVMGRLAVINRASSTIIRGNLSARVPFTRGGDEFDDLSSNLNRMLDTIESLMQSINQFAGNIAHDLRSPLTRIINRLDSSLRTIDDANPARKTIEKNIQDMQELVDTFNSILKISELETDAGLRRFEPCDAQKVIANLVEFYEPYAAEKNIALKSAIGSPVMIRGEKNLLTQAFANLIDNALKFTPPGGRVSISAEGRDIVIADSGPGIPREFHGKVFEKFFRLEESRSAKGNGLGLSLVAAIARIHNARIAFEDNQPGLKVRISFPQ